MSITTVGDPADLAKLFAKIAHVTAAMKRVPKSGRNQFHKYDYATESDIVDAIRTAMGEHNLAIIPSVERVEGINPDITRLHMQFIVACGDTGAYAVMSWVGDGQDKADKGVYKAYTGAEKYFLMKLFLVATGDDPEQDEPQQRQAPPAEANSTHRKAAEQLRDLRQELTRIGGTVPMLTSSQVAKMSIGEINSMIAQTRDDLEQEKQRLATEVAQQELPAA